MKGARIRLGNFAHLTIAAQQSCWPNLSAVLSSYSDDHVHGMPCWAALSRHALFRLTSWGTAVIKIAIVVGATLAVVTAAGAADIPRRQPVYQQAPVGKMPIGKTPIGKSPIGKAPGPVVSRY